MGGGRRASLSIFAQPVDSKKDKDKVRKTVAA